MQERRKINGKGILKAVSHPALRIFLYRNREINDCCGIFFFFLPWHRRRGDSSLHTQSPRTQHPAAPHHTQQDHQSHPDNGGAKQFNIKVSRKLGILISSKYFVYFATAEIDTWQESLPPSVYPAQNMASVIMPG